MKYEVPCDTELHVRLPQQTLVMLKEQAGRNGRKMSDHVRFLVDSWRLVENQEHIRALGMKPRKE